MKKPTMTAVSALLLCLCHGYPILSLAEGDCDAAVWGHNESWRSFESGGLQIKVRTCDDKYGFSHADVFNPYSETICVTIVAENSNERWSNWYLKPGKVLSQTVKGLRENWRLSAKAMTNNHCSKEY